MKKHLFRAKICSLALCTLCKFLAQIFFSLRYVLTEKEFLVLKSFQESKVQTQF